MILRTAQAFCRKSAARAKLVPKTLGGKDDAAASDDPNLKSDRIAEIRTAHPPATHVAIRHWRGLLLRLVRDHRVGGDERAGDRSRVPERHAHDLGWIDDAGARGVDQRGAAASFPMVVDAMVVSN